MAIDDGDRFVAVFYVKTEVLEASVWLGFNEFVDEPVLEELDPVGQNESGVMCVHVNINRRYLTAGEHIADPNFDVAFAEFILNADIDSAKFAEAQNVQRMHVDGLDDVRG